MRGKILVTPRVLAGLDYLLSEREDYHSVTELVEMLKEAGFREAAEWVNENPEAFWEGLSRGFDREDEGSS